MKYIFSPFFFLYLCLMAQAKLSDERLDHIKLQIFLDQRHFGPGVIDGKLGTYTKMAAQAYNQQKQRPLSDEESIRQEAREAILHPFATAIVPLGVNDFVDTELPSDKYRKLQAKKKQMSYRSVAEFMAERYHTTEELLVSLNGAKTIRNLKPRTALKVPNITPFLIEDLANGRSYRKDLNLSRRWIVVDTEKNQLRIFEAAFDLPDEEELSDTSIPNASSSNREGNTDTETLPTKAIVVEEDFVPYDESNAELIAAFPITPGKPEFIHYGKWKLKNAIEFPTWRYDKQLLETGKRSNKALHIPPGPNNPVGVIWLGLSKSGIGIHGTNSPRTIGRARSSGCIRMANWDVVHVPKYVRPGATVIIK